MKKLNLRYVFGLVFFLFLIFPSFGCKLINEGPSPIVGDDLPENDPPDNEPPENETPVAGVCDNVSLTHLDAISNSINQVGQSITMSGHYIFQGISGGDDGLQIFDATDPSQLTLLDHFPTNSGAAQMGSDNDVLGVTLHQDLAYLTTYYGGLVILDVSDKNSIVYKGKLDLPGESWKSAYKNNVIYIANKGGTDEFYAIDVSDPTNPAILDSLDLASGAQEVAIYGNYAFVVTWPTLFVIDISDPNNLSSVGNLSIPGGRGYGIWIGSTGNYAYIVDKLSNELLTVDISNPFSPSLVDQNTEVVGQTFRSIIGIDSKVFVGTGDGSVGKVIAYDLSDPAHPSYIEEISATNRVYGLTGDASGVLFTSNGSGLGVDSIGACE